MGCRVVSLGDVIQLEDSKRQPLSSREVEKAAIPTMALKVLSIISTTTRTKAITFSLPKTEKTLGRESSLSQMQPRVVSG